MYVYNNLRGNFSILTTFFGHFKQVNVKCHQDVIADSCLTKKCWFLNQEIGSNHFSKTPDILEVCEIHAKRAKQTNQCSWKKPYLCKTKFLFSIHKGWALTTTLSISTLLKNTLSKVSFVALLWHITFKFRTFKIHTLKCEIYWVRLNFITEIPWATSITQKN